MSTANDDGYVPIVHCPLCGGPVHEEDDGVIRCAVGHEVDRQEVVASTESRLAEAMWMAIEALESEATMLRLLSPTDEAERYADDAERQADVLRDFSRRHDASGLLRGASPHQRGDGDERSG